MREWESILYPGDNTFSSWQKAVIRDIERVFFLDEKLVISVPRRHGISMMYEYYRTHTDLVVKFNEVATPEVEAPVAPVPPKDTPEEKESPEDIKRRARKPPSEGPCKGCGKNKPLNRLFLCYPCWVKKENEKSGWREGQPHPATCGCDLDCRFDSKGGNN